MSRPMMQPNFAPEAEQAAKPKRAPLLVRVVVGFFKAIAAFIRYLFSSPVEISRRRRGIQEPGTRASRFVRGLLYRALYLPILVALCASVLVFTGTHPRSAVASADPASHGLFFETLDFEGADGTDLRGWLIPVIDARKVLEKRDKLFRSKNPAILLVHDFDESPQQVLPLLSPLHDDGFVVMTVGLRGWGNKLRAGQTFGLNESGDVLAALEALRKRHFVSEDRIGLFGIGSGATAAALAAELDPRVRAIILIDPIRDPLPVLRSHIGPERDGLRWMQPVCKWAFEIGYRVDAEDIDGKRIDAVMASRPSLQLERSSNRDEVLSPESVKKLREFYRKSLHPNDDKTATVR